MERGQRLRTTANDNNTNTRLSLRIKNGNSAHYNKLLEITPSGLIGGLRNVEDGHVFFGTLKHSMPDSKG